MVASYIFWTIITARVRSTREGNVLTPVCVSVHTFRGGGGSPVSVKEKFLTPDLAWYMFRLEKKFLLRTLPPHPPPPPPLVKGKFFDTRFGWIHVQTGKKNFLLRDPPSVVKGKFFDTRFGLIHVQTGKKIFCQGTSPPPSKGKNFWHQIWLDTCSDWKKNFFVKGPPLVKGKFFDTRFGLIHVQTGKKFFFLRDPP